MGLTVSFYLDDSWQAAKSCKKCINTCFQTFKVVTSCGFLPNLKKSQLIPSQCITILGTVVDSVKMIIYLPKEKERKILSLIKHTLEVHHMTIHELACIIGKLISCTAVCPLGRLYYRSLERVKLQYLKLNGIKWDSNCRLSEAARIELNCWLKNLENSCTPIFHPNPHLTLTFDVCDYGWGCSFAGKITQGHFSSTELPLSINTKETIAIWYGFCSFAHQLKNAHLKFLSDNTTAVSYVHSFGGMNSELRTKIACDIWTKAVEINSWITITHLPGILNTESDVASRILSEQTEWHLHPAIFRKILKHFQIMPSIDLFASCLNNQLPIYSSFTPDPFCVAVDAFSFSWS